MATWTINKLGKRVDALAARNAKLESAARLLTIQAEHLIREYDSGDCLQGAVRELRIPTERMRELLEASND